MNKVDLKVKEYRLKFADGRCSAFTCVNDLQAKSYARHLVHQFVDDRSNSYKLFKGGFAKLYYVTKKNNESHLVFLSKIYPFKSKFFKAINLWSGKRTFVPVNSRHVVHCAICRYLTDDFAGVCNRCQGCLDCRSTYYRPVTESVSFIKLLDRIDKFNDLPF